MRIAYVSADRGVRPAGRGGSATHVRELVRALVARGAAVTVLTPAADGAARVLGCEVVDLQAEPGFANLRDRIYRSLHSRSIHSRSIHDRRVESLDEQSQAPHEAISLLLNDSLTRALESMSPPPDIVYERQSLWSVAGLQFAQRRGIPHLLEVNAPLVEQQRDYRQLDLVPVATAIEDFLLSSSDRVLVTSPALVPYARDHGASGRRVRTVPCGVPGALLHHRRAFGKRNSPTQFVIGFVGSLKPWHGLDVLLQAFRKLHDIDFGYRLLIVGDGPLRESVEAWLRSHNLHAFAEITGEVEPEAIAGWLAKMDVAVAPYPDLPLFYFSPLKIWEYAGAGVPIAASESGDLPRLFPHREAALLHRPGSVTKLVSHIERLRTSPGLASRLARRARQIARTHTWDRIAARVERIADDALRARATRE